MGITKVLLALDYHEVDEALKAPQQWPRYRNLLEQVKKLKEDFTSLVFEGEKISTNGIVRDIAKSVLRDGRFQSYLALDGPSCLHDRIARETCGSDIWFLFRMLSLFMRCFCLGLQGIVSCLGFYLFWLIIQDCNEITISTLNKQSVHDFRRWKKTPKTNIDLEFLINTFKINIVCIF